MAETLFADGKKRMAAGDFAGACPKLAESYRLDPGSGTLTALALCHEQTGKTASAWAEFIEVVTEAQQAGRADREKYAKQHVAALEPVLSRLTIAVSPDTAHLPQIELRRDKVLVGPAAWGVASPVDPGDHLVEVSAPGKQPWSTHVTVAVGADNRTVAVPALEDVPAPEAAPPTPPPVAPEAAEPVRDTGPPAHQGGTQRTLGVVLGVAGLASVAVGTYFGVNAISESNTAKQACPNSRCTDPGALQTNDSAKNDAVVSDIAVGAGAAAVVAGVILFLTAPRDVVSEGPAAAGEPSDAGRRCALGGVTRHRVQVVPTASLHGAGLLFQSAW